MWVWLSGVLGHWFGTGSTLDGLGGVQGLFRHPCIIIHYDTFIQGFVFLY